MKKSFLLLGCLFLLAGTTMFLTGCSNENSFKDGQTVTFAVVAENAKSTKGAADGDGAASGIDHWIMEILDSDGDVYNRQEKEAAKGTLNLTFDVKLVVGQTYDVLFWADTKGTYDVTKLTEVKLVSSESTGYAANKDSRDAFSASVLDFTVESDTFSTVTLRRPFAQLNVVFTDLDTLYKTISSETEYAKYKPESLEVKVSMPTVFNVKAQAADNASVKELTITAESNYLDNYSKHGKSETLFMDYFFTNDTKAMSLIDIDFSFNSFGNSIAHKFSSIPFKSNYRTNIKGDLMTVDAEWTVTVDPTWSTPANDTIVTKVSY